SALARRLKDENRIGAEIQFDTLYYIEAGDKKSSHFPHLVGFTDPVDREFFSLFTQVPGMGVRKALKSLVMPIREIAAAIENKDAATLQRLPGVGGRLADKIIAELHGKTAKFALSKSQEPLSTPKPQAEPFVEEAREILIQLQYGRDEAEAMINRALEADPKINRVEDLISVIFREQQEAMSKA
ncbi:MAG: hypothetical protein D6800_02085, partial [Candidatus Zixiibacteriota bacterium]